MSDTDRTWWQGLDGSSAYTQSVGTEMSGYAIAALVIATASWFVPLLIIGPVAALVYARKGRRQAERTGQPGVEMARAARIIAGWLLVLQLLALAAVLGVGIGLGYDLGPLSSAYRGE